MTTFEKVQRIIADQLGVGEDEVRADTPFLGGVLACDSLDIVELAMAAEDEFDIEVADDDFEKMATVGDAVALIDARLR